MERGARDPPLMGKGGGGVGGRMAEGAEGYEENRISNFREVGQDRATAFLFTFSNHIVRM